MSADPVSTGDPPGAGGGGGAGGSGGEGGQGGGGAGGASIGLVTAGVDTVEVRSSTLRGGAGGAGAPGGQGGRNGAAGAAASGSVGRPVRSRCSPTVVRYPGGERAAGGSFGWFDDGATGQILDDETIEPGAPGAGGPGAEPGPTGDAEPTNL